MYDIIVLDIGSSECDSEVTATDVLHSLGILIRACQYFSVLDVKLQQHNFCKTEAKEKIQVYQIVMWFWGNS